MATPSGPPAHTCHVRVRYAETDQAGVAYHANYLQWFEVGRTELLRGMGLPYAGLERDRGLLLTVVEAMLRYHRPARYDDRVEIVTWITDIRRVRFRLEHRLARADGGELLCTGHIWLAAITRDAQPVPLPADLVAILRSAPGGGPEGRPGELSSSQGVLGRRPENRP